VGHTGIGNDFLNKTPVAHQLKERIDKWDYMNLKASCTSKEMVTRLKRQSTEWEKIFTSYIPDKGLIPGFTRISKQLNSPKSVTQ
jgi:hypothetical protein